MGSSKSDVCSLGQTLAVVREESAVALNLLAMNSSKQFVIDRILDQSRLERVSLTDIEIRMLNFTEASSGSKDLAAAEAFERDYNDEEYEAKIANLIRHAYERDRQSGQVGVWNQALAKLAIRDLYLNVMIDRARIGSDPAGFLGDWRFLLYGILPPALCFGAAVLVCFSPFGARFIGSDALRLLVAGCLLAIPFLTRRHSKALLRPKRFPRQ